MAYYSVFRKKEILSFATMEDTVLSEISGQRKPTIAWYYLPVESLKKANSQTVKKKKKKKWLSENGEWGKQKEFGKSVQTFIYKRNKLLGFNGDYGQ